MRLKTKNIFSLLLIGSLGMFLTTGCSDDNDEALTPLAEIAVSGTELAVGQSVTIHFTGVADQVVVFTGDKNHEYELRDSSNTGLVVNKGVLTYSYSVPGTFHLVCVASTYDTFNGKNLQQDTIGVFLRVSDMVTDIDAIYSTVTPNVYYATRQGDDWVMCLPTKQLYNNREITVNAARQRLVIEAGSDSARVYIDDVLYSSRDYYALNTDHTLKVVSGSGAVKDYRFYGMVYPEFNTITVDGVAPALQRSAFYQDLLTYSVSGSRLDFTLDADVELLANGEPVASGSDIRRDAEYTLVRTHAGNPQVKAVTRVVFEMSE